MSDNAKIIGGAIAFGAIGFLTAGAGATAGAKFTAALQGAALGASIGAAFTTTTLDPQVGSRVEDLELQNSAYGNFIPRTYGSDRFPTNVFWLENNKIEEIKTERQVELGKNREQTVTEYTYKGSFAAAVCEGPVDAIDKIWLDGTLIYSSSPLETYELEKELREDLAEVGELLYRDLRIYLGDQNQNVDPLIESDQPDSPSYRNLAYIVFEDLYLGYFGNRIPVVTVETVNNSNNSQVLGTLINGPVSQITFDGSNWIDGQGPFPEISLSSPLDIKQANGIWVATQCDNTSVGCIARSEDGINWTTINTPSADNFLVVARNPNTTGGIEYVGNNTWYAFGPRTTAGSSTGQLIKIFKSVDNALTWDLVGDFELSSNGFSNNIISWAHVGNGEWYFLTGPTGNLDLGRVTNGGTVLSYVGAVPTLATAKAIFYVGSEIWVWGDAAGGTYNTGYSHYVYSTDGGSNWLHNDNQPYVVINNANEVKGMWKEGDNYYTLSYSVSKEGDEGGNPNSATEEAAFLEHNADFSTVRRVFTFDEFQATGIRLTLSNSNNTSTISIVGASNSYTFESTDGLGGIYIQVSTPETTNLLITTGVAEFREDYIRATTNIKVFDTILNDVKIGEVDVGATVFGEFLNHEKGIVQVLWPIPGNATTRVQYLDPRDYSSEVGAENVPMASPEPEVLQPIPLERDWAVGMCYQATSPVALVHLPTGSVYFVNNFRNQYESYNPGNENWTRVYAVSSDGVFYLFCPDRWNPSSDIQNYSFNGICKIDLNGYEPQERELSSITGTVFDPDLNASYSSPRAMSVDAATSKLYATETDSSGNIRQVYEINPSTMVKTYLGDFNETNCREVAYFGSNNNYLYNLSVKLPPPGGFGAVVNLNIYLNQGGLNFIRSSEMSTVPYTNVTLVADNSYLYLGGAHLSHINRGGLGTAISAVVRIAGNQPFMNNTATLDVILKEELLKSSLVKEEDLKFTGLTNLSVRGFSVTSAKTIKTIMEPLATRFNLLGREKDYQIEILNRATNVSSIATIQESDLQAHEVGQTVPDKLSIQKPSSFVIPSKVEISYKDIDKQFESNTQYVENLDVDNINIEAINLDIVMSADEAAQTVDSYLEQKKLAGQGLLSFVTHSEFSYISPGDKVTVTANNETYDIEVESVDVGKPGLVQVSGFIYDSDVFTSNETGVTGINYPVVIKNVPLTLTKVFETVPLSTADNDYGYYYTVYPAKNPDSWNGAVTYKSSDNSNYGEISFNNNVPVIGSCVDKLSGNMLTGVFDSSETLNVRIYSGTPQSVTEDVLRRDEGNVFAYGLEGRWEIIKAQNVTLESDGTYTFSKFVRGYLNTEHNMANHENEDQLILLTRSVLGRVINDVNNYTNPQYLKSVSVGLSLNSGIVLQPQPTGLAQQPPSVAHATVKKLANNDWQFDWIRRARFAWGWQNNSDVPLDFTTEQYVVRIVNADPYNGTIASDGLPEAIREISVTDATTATYTEAQQIADWGSAQTNIYALIYQVNPNWGNGVEVLVSWVSPEVTINDLDLYLWLDASDSSNISTSGSAVTAMTDKSGNGRNVTGVGSPELISADQNSLDTIRFNGSSRYLDFGSDVVPAGDFYIAVVWKRINTNSVAVVYSGSHTNRTYLQLSSSLQAGTNGTIGVSPPVGQYNIVGLSFDADGNTEAYVNGALEGTRTTFGARGMEKIFGNYGSDKYLAEVIVVEDITTETRDIIENYLSNKWNITIS